MAAERPCSRNTHGRATKPGQQPPIAPRLSRAFPPRNLRAALLLPHLQGGLWAHPRPRTPRQALLPPGRPSYPQAARKGLPRPRLLLQGASHRPSGPGRGAHHDCGRPGAGPPGPLPAFSGPPAGAGGPTAAAAALARPRRLLSAPRRLRRRRALRPQVRSPQVPAVLNRPRAQPPFYSSPRRRPLAAPVGGDSARDVSTHGPRR